MKKEIKAIVEKIGRGLKIVHRKISPEPKEKKPAPELTKQEAFVAGLSIEQLLLEYYLISKKDSKLPLSLRKIIQYRVVFLVEEGVIKMKKKE